MNETGSQAWRANPKFMNAQKPRLVHEQRILVLALAAGFPAVLTCMLILWLGDYTSKVQWTLTVAIVGVWLGFCFALRERVASPLRTLANLLEAMREGDYSIRARGSKSDDAMGEVMQQVNAMSSTLRAQRLGALEATTLLRKVMEEINVAVFAFDGERRLRLVNRAGERMLGQPAERILGSDAAHLDLDDTWKAKRSKPCSAPFPEPPRAGASAAAPFAKADCRTSCWWSPISPALCARKN